MCCDAALVYSIYSTTNCRGCVNVYIVYCMLPPFFPPFFIIDHLTAYSELKSAAATFQLQRHTTQCQRVWLFLQAKVVPKLGFNFN